MFVAQASLGVGCLLKPILVAPLVISDGAARGNGVSNDEESDSNHQGKHLLASEISCGVENEFVSLAGGPSS